MKTFVHLAKRVADRPPAGPVPPATGRSGSHRRGEVRGILHGPRLQAEGDQLRRQPAAGGPVSEAEEAAFAFSHPGQVEDVGATAVSAEPNELLLWNYLVGRSDLRPPHVARMTATAVRWRKLLKDRPDLKVKIVGSASQTGSAAANETLALARAEKVRQLLLQSGIPADRIEAVGVGNREPLADPTSAENLARNRRVEVFLFSPLTEVSSLGPAVQPEVLSFVPTFPATERLSFDTGSNFFHERLVRAIVAGALVRLSGPPSSEMGILQFLTGDVRRGIYEAPGGRRVELDYARCTSPFLPCRDVEEATNRFSFEGAGRTTGPTSAPTLLTLDDSPGIAVPLREPFSGLNGRLVGTRWAMTFAIVVGARVGGDFLPIRNLVWQLSSSRTVDVAARSATGSPVVVELSRGTGMPAGVSLGTATSLRTCRFLTRRMDLPPTFAGVCRPEVTIR